MPRPQTTLAGAATVAGVAFFTGGDVTVTFRPAPAGTGVLFVRTDLPGAPTVPATIEYALELPRRTGVRRGEAEVQLTEHVLAALAGLRVDNCRVEIDGPELPGLDGSAAGFVRALRSVGTVKLDAERAALRVHRPVTVTAGDAALTASPPPVEQATDCDAATYFEYRLDCGPSHPVAPHAFASPLTPRLFEAEIGAARTFITAAEIPALRTAGYGERVVATDLLVFEADGSVRGQAARFPNEPARHKLLDMVGDFALLGCDLHASILSERGGHATSRALCRALQAALVSEDGAVTQENGVPSTRTAP